MNEDSREGKLSFIQVFFAEIISIHKLNVRLGIIRGCYKQEADIFAGKRLKEAGSTEYCVLSLSVFLFLSLYFSLSPSLFVSSFVLSLSFSLLLCVSLRLSLYHLSFSVSMFLSNLLTLPYRCPLCISYLHSQI